ncbi:uncharacterized protein A4U43_C07F9800 [Asparagus officinalis]|uniref:Tubby C-terminal domain-containing protein n=2 Tax=Asparagus officinalis TaxID=4686 RepID=A0A5P1EFU9_ASPOF|nr:uncharacterized protein A4U43_C07F9800 [Asparagus officinalis]
MKSLVLNGNGCTVYNSKGQIAYRVDNYDHKCGGEVYLMNLDGKILFKIVKKKHRICGRWEGYKCNDGLQGENSRPWFKVKKPCYILRGFQPLYCEVSVDADHSICCKINKTSNSSYKIVGISGELLAEVKRKHTKSGIDLGDDVLTLVVEPNIDQSLIMGMVVVYALVKFNM